MRNKGQPNHPPEVKQAVLAALLTGQGVEEIAKQYNIPHQTVSRWRALLSGDELGEIGRKKADELGELLLGYVRESLITLKAHAVFFRNKDWLSKQDASEVGVLHGIQMDKVIRLLEAHEAGLARKEKEATHLRSVGGGL